MAWRARSLAWILALSGCAGSAAGSPDVGWVAAYPGAPPVLTGDEVGIWGSVQNEEDGSPIEGALVVIQSSSSGASYEQQTDANGRYAVEHIPPGTTTIRVLFAQADVAKVATIPAGARFVAHFQIDPNRRLGCRLPVVRPMDDASLFSVRSAEEARLLGMPRTIHRR